jgi:hypothetical protein
MKVANAGRHSQTTRVSEAETDGWRADQVIRKNWRPTIQRVSVDARIDLPRPSGMAW